MFFVLTFTRLDPAFEVLKTQLAQVMPSVPGAQDFRESASLPMTAQNSVPSSAITTIQRNNTVGGAVQNLLLRSSTISEVAVTPNIGTDSGTADAWASSSAGSSSPSAEVKRKEER